MGMLEFYSDKNRMRFIYKVKIKNSIIYLYCNNIALKSKI